MSHQVSNSNPNPPKYIGEDSLSVSPPVSVQASLQLARQILPPDGEKSLGLDLTSLHLSTVNPGQSTSDLCNSDLLARVRTLIGDAVTTTPESPSQKRKESPFGELSNPSKKSHDSTAEGEFLPVDSPTEQTETTQRNFNSQSLSEWLTLDTVLKGLKEGKRLCINKESQSLAVKATSTSIFSGGTAKQAAVDFLTLFVIMSEVAKTADEVQLIDATVDEVQENQWLHETVDETTLQNQLHVVIRHRLTNAAKELLRSKDAYKSVLHTFKKYPKADDLLLVGDNQLRLNLISSHNGYKTSALGDEYNAFDQLLIANGWMFDVQHSESLLTNEKMFKAARSFCKETPEVFAFVTFLKGGTHFKTQDACLKDYYGNLIQTEGKTDMTKQKDLNLDAKTKKQFSDQTKDFCDKTLEEKQQGLDAFIESIALRAFNESGIIEKLKLGFNKGMQI